MTRILDARRTPRKHASPVPARLVCSALGLARPDMRRDTLPARPANGFLRGTARFLLYSYRFVVREIGAY